MAVTVESPNEVYLGGTRFPIVGAVTPRLLSQFPNKIVIGDTSYADESLSSNLVLSDQRGGILVENMDIKKDLARAYWSACNLGFKSHIVKPPSATDCGTGTRTAQAVTAGLLSRDLTAFTDPDWVAANLVDSNTGTKGFTVAATTGASGWVKITFASAVALAEWRYYVSYTGGTDSWSIQYSDDNSTWTTCATLAISASTGWKTVTWSPVGAHIYWRSLLTLTGTTIQYYMELLVYTANNPTALIDYDGVIYACFDKYLHSFDSVNKDFNDAVQTLAIAPVSPAVICQNCSWIPVGTGYYVNPKLWIPDQIVDGGLNVWTDSDTLTSWTDVGSGVAVAKTLAKESTDVQEGLYSAKLYVNTPTGDACMEIYRSPYLSPSAAKFAGKSLTVTAKVKSSTAGRGRIVIASGAYADSGIDTDEALDDSETGVDCDADATTAIPVGTIIYIESEQMFVTATGTTLTVIRGYNGTTAAGHVTNFNIYKVAATVAATVGTGWETVTCTATVGTAGGFQIRLQALAPSGSATTTVYFDDVQISYSETTAPWIYFPLTAAEFFVDWDGKVFKIDSTGQLSYCANNSVYNNTPDLTNWTNNGKLRLPDNYVTSLSVYRDADGNPIIYAGTKRGLYAHDYVTATWIATELSLPEHPTAAKGATPWRDGFFISSGLGVMKYIAGQTAAISSMGLDRDDGLPAEYRGEIASLIKGFNEFYALVDSTYIGGTEKSSVMAYDGNGWQVKWASSYAQGANTCGVVSSDYSAYRLYWGCDRKIYFIDLERDVRNPTKITSYAYATGTHIHLFPWFDADWPDLDKLIKKLRIFVASAAATETVLVKYRLDRTYTDLDTGWTTLATIVAAGASEQTFASGVGVKCKTIQFRLDLTTTTTLSPDVQYLVLSYVKMLPTQWGWSFQVDCSQTYKSLSPSQLVAALKALAEPGTLSEFTYRDQSSGTHTAYVRITTYEGIELPGHDWSGKYNVMVYAP